MLPLSPDLFASSCSAASTASPQIHPAFDLTDAIRAAESLTGLGSEYVRPPRKPLVGAERARVLEILKEGLANRPELPDYLHLEVA